MTIDARRPTEDDIQAWLIEKITAMDDVDAASVDIREPFSSYGLTSRAAVGLSGDLEEWLGRRLSPALVYEHPTIEALARHLAAGLS